jgi:hypothetical protein
MAAENSRGIGGTIHHIDMTIASEFLRIGGTAALTHYLVSFCQTVFHQRLGHRRLGGKLFRNHVRWHHGYYAGDHMVSEKYLTEHGNNTPFFLIPIAGVAAASWSLLPLDLFVTHVATLALSFYVHVYLDAQYHVTGCWLGRFRWFRRKQQLHFVHHSRPLIHSTRPRNEAAGCSATAACGSSSPSTVRKVPSSLSQKKSMTAKLVLA